MRGMEGERWRRTGERWEDKSKLFEEGRWWSLGRNDQRLLGRRSAVLDAQLL